MAKQKKTGLHILGTIAAVASIGLAAALLLDISSKKEERVELNLKK